YAMTGWRIGWALGTPELIGAMDNVASNPVATMAQWAAVEALRGDQSDVAEMREIFQRRRDRALELLKKIPNLQVPKPEGAFYLFINFKSYLGKETLKGQMIKNDVDLADYLLEEFGVATVPGSAFGKEGYLRLSYGVSDADLEEGIRRIGEGLSQLEA